MSTPALDASPALKTEIMFEGVRYSDALAKAAEHALPNYYPYRFQKGEVDPTGTGKATVPYLMITEDQTLIRVMGNGSSAWSVQGSHDDGYRLTNDDDGLEHTITFQPQDTWMSTSYERRVSNGAGGR